MKKLSVFVAMIFLASCNSAPIQMGNEKYKITHPAVGQTAAIEEAQRFCRGKGFSYAEVTRDFDDETVFFCMNEGDKIVNRNAPKVCVGVNNC